MILITQPRVGTSHNEILALQVAAREEGWDVLSAPSGWRLDDDLIKSGVPGVAYGSQTFCEVIAMQMNWRLKANSFDWLAKLPQQYLQRNVQFMTLGEAKLLKETKFIKPADDKVFAAAVYSPGTLHPHETVPNDTPTLVSDVVQFDLEYRCFVNEFGRVVTWSNYICYEHQADPRFWDMVPDSHGFLKPHEFVSYMLYHSKDYGIETVASVIDVGHIPGKGWAIIETNQAWASGIYGCDPGKVLEVLAQSVTI
jgi:hypothetical protein